MIANLRLRPLAFGLASYVPGVTRVFRRGTGGTSSARYCYSVWMRHLISAHACKQTRLPETVAELGPGDSLGVGLAALLTGANHYYALDFIKYADNLENLGVFDELLALFSKRTAIPDDQEFPLIIPRLNSYDFPSYILGDELLKISLASKRVQNIRAAISGQGDASTTITYMAPWLDADIVKKHSVDMIFSQAVLEHIDGIRLAYEAMRQWLHPTGCMTHSIDFKSHGLTKDWNGHWTQSDIAWKLLRGRRPYMINREPHSVHVQMLRDSGFDILCDERYELPSRIADSMVASRFCNMSSEDFHTSDAFIVAAPTARNLTA